MQSAGTLSDRFINRYGIWIVLAVAAFLRLFRINEMALSNDELSVLARCRYDSLSDLLRFGVVQNDMHPPLVQVFVYYYTRLFGDHPLTYKLPFILIGIGSVYVAFRLFSNMFNRHTASLVAVFMASLQYFIVHAQTARMYAPALLFTLLFTGQLFRSRDTSAYRPYIKGGVLLLLVANTHYMALVTCAFAGLLFIAFYRENIRRWMVTFCISAALFTAEVPLLIAQFRQGGLTWIAVPGWRYICDYLDYLSQFNKPLLVFWLALLIAAMFMLVKGNARVGEGHKRNLLFCLLLFVISFAFAFFYSRINVPIIQYSILQFSAPFLLAFISYPLSRFKLQHVAAICLLLLIINIFYLVTVRKHYQVYYRQAYQASVDAIMRHAGPSTPLFLNAQGKYYYEYYFSRNGFQPNIINARIDSFTYPHFEKMIRETTSDTIVISHGFVLPYEYVSIAAQVYDRELYVGHEVLSDTYILARSHNPESAHTASGIFDANHEYGEVSALEFQASHAVMNVEVIAAIEGKDAGIDPGLVLRIMEDGKEVLWRQVKYHAFRDPAQNTAKLVINVAAYLTKGKSYRAEAFIWNDQKKEFMASRPVIRIVPGNQNLFGTLLPLNEE
jgi:hypothetical protein